MTKVEDTKTKIVQVARELFAKRGFDGTSVRDIANAAGVNVAALNYHFENKENLFWEIFRLSMQDLSAQISELQAERRLPAEELAVQIFHLMNSNWMEVRNTFRMMLSPELPKASHGDGADFCQGKLGPPGGEVLAAAMLEKLGKNIADEALMWGVRAVFSQIAHMALVINTVYAKTFIAPELAFVLDPEYVAESIREQTKAILGHLETSSEGLATRLNKLHT